MPNPPLRPIPSRVEPTPSPSLGLIIERHLSSSLTFTASRPNAEPLWTDIRAAATDYLMTLFVQGVLMGSKPAEAFFVQCDRTTTTQNDIDNNIVNLLIGFAPTKPAEFTILRLALPTGPNNP
jgi:phage tail sheath protein FI